MVDNRIDGYFNSKVNRGLVIGLGAFGARTLAHLWPRMRFEDDQRQVLRPGLPALSKMVTYHLILPQKDGGFQAGIPDPVVWDSINFNRKVGRLSDLPWDSLDHGPEFQLYEQELPASFSNGHSFSVAGGITRPGRESFFQTIIDHAHPFAEHLVQVSELSRVDEDAPGFAADHFSIYIVASLAEPAASAMLWPLVMLLRQQMALHLPLEIVGLLSVGAYGSRREQQRAFVQAALCEQAYFQNEPGPDPADFGDRLIYHEQWFSQPYFDYCYLLDSEKQNKTRPKGEEEIIIAMGNALETFLLSDANDQVAVHIGPDLSYLRRKGAFSALGAASIYIPIDEWQARNRQQYILDLLRASFMRSSDSGLGDFSGPQFPDDRFSLANLTQEMIRECPIERVHASINIHSSANNVGQLLTRARLISPRTVDGPGIPLPQLQVQDAEIQFQFYEQAREGEKSRRLPLNDWLGHLFAHYQNLGLAAADIFPGETNLEIFQAEHPAPAQTRLREWFDWMLLACERHSAALLDESVATDVPRLALASQEPAGLIADAEKALLEYVSTSLITHNQGINLALARLQEMSQQLRDQIHQIADYRERLAAALHGDAMREARTTRARQRLQFQRRLANRPRVAGMFIRGLLLITLLTAVMSELGPRFFLIPEMINVPIWALLLSTAVSILGLSSYALIHYWLLRRGFRRIEQGLADMLHIQLNHGFAQILLSQTEADELVGLLPDLNRLVLAYRDTLIQTRSELQEREQQLQQELSEPLTIHQPYLRQPLPGLEDLEQKLTEESRSAEPEEIPEDLVARDTRHAAQFVAPLLQQQVRRLNSAAQTTPVAGYESLGDLLLKVIERRAGRLKNIIPPANLKIEQLLETCYPTYSPRGFLASLEHRAHPFLRWDDEDIARDALITLDLLSLDDPASSPEIGPEAAASNIQITGSMDPFAITRLNLVHGICLEAIPHFRVYGKSFIAQGFSEQSRLAIHASLLQQDGTYMSIDPLSRVRLQSGDAFVEFPIDPANDPDSISITGGF